MNDERTCTHCHNKLCIHKVPIFSGLGQEDMRKVAKLITHREYKKGEFLFREGDKLDALIIINEGSVKAVKYTNEGREQILHVFMEGDFLGEKYLLANETAEYSVEVLRKVKICMITKESFHELLYQYPGIAINIIEVLGKRMGQLEATVKSLGVRSVDSRICELLLGYGNQYGKKVPDGIIIDLPLNREDIANYLGIARETLSRKLGALEDEGIIRSVGNKHILLLKEDELKFISGLET